MKKRFFAVVLCVSFILALTGCGSRPNTSATQKPSVTPAMAQESTTQYSGEESINSETTEPTTNQSNVTDVAVDPAPYWQGDNYFDMYGYLEACGCKVLYTGIDDDGDTFVSETYSSSITGYSIYFEESSFHPNDSSACLLLYFTNGLLGGNCLSYEFYDENNRLYSGFQAYPIIENKRDIVVDQYNNTFDIHTITQIEMLINKIFATQYHGENPEDMKDFFKDYNQS